MKIAICEDNLRENARLFTFLEGQYPDSEIEQFFEGQSLLKYLENNKPDIVILDVEMPGINGIETARLLREKYPVLGLIFTTGHTEFALEAFGVYAADYLIKPIDRDRLVNSINKIMRIENVDESYINVQSRGTLFRVNQADILFIEKITNKCMIHTLKFEYSMITPLKYFEKRLDPQHFVKTHKAFIVNRRRVSSVIARGNMTYDIYFYGTDKKAVLSRGMHDKLSLLKYQ